MEKKELGKKITMAQWVPLAVSIAGEREAGLGSQSAEKEMKRGPFVIFN